MARFEIDQDDQHFYKVCFKLLDLTNDAMVSRFEVYKILSSALQTNATETNELVDIIWEQVLEDTGIPPALLVQERCCMVVIAIIWHLF